ncbi:hypothetical protein V4F39_03140 [Aquincola sp. MAHUQ-54]|uniref:Uncharacterized protein n=1 Tax=Aquincola agrisoli TaxID=3119538 RepID=A0AAW9Q5Z9_9BURK
MKLPFAQLHGPLFVTTVFGTLVLARLLALAIPTDFYFTFQSLFSDRTPQSILVSLIGKMAAPLAVGLALGLWCIAAWQRAARTRGGARHGFARRVRFVFGPTAFAGGFFAAFVAAWPAMIYWDLMANPALAHLKLAFFGLYVLYMLGFGYVTLLGLLLAVYLREHWQQGPPGSESVSMRELSRVGALWLLNSGLAAAAMKVLTE